MTLLALGVSVLAGGCGESSELVSVLPETQATAVPSPIEAETPTPPPVPQESPTVAEEAPLTPEPSTPEPSTPEPSTPESPTPETPPAETAETAPAATEPTVVQEVLPTPGPAGSFNRGLLQEQFCVVDIVSPDTLNVRAGPSTDDAIIAMFAEGACRIFLTGGVSDGWREIVAEHSGAEIRGWVSGNFITPLRAAIDPNAPMTVITVTLEYGFDSASSEASIDAFQLINADGFVVGFLDLNGQITVPADLDFTRTRISAEFANDRFCVWTGLLRLDGADGRYIAELSAICA